MKPLAWSYTSLEDFVNCPRAFYEKRVAKSVKDDPDQTHLIWGNRVHKEFELYVGDGTPLSPELETHQAFLDSLRDREGEVLVERKIALSKQGKPCGFFDKDVWMRGVIDYSNIDGATAEIVDYKTGKPHTKFKQLKIFALHIMTEYPDVQAVRVRFYWTKTQTCTGDTYTRRMMSDLWGSFIPDLFQYKEAFASDVWQPRQSGLCNGWCPVTDCDFWKPKRNK